MLERFERSDFNDIHEILESSFPRDERRDREGQLRIFDRPEYRVLGIREEADKNGVGACAAIMAIWEFDDFIYLEHFAVKESMRNGGLGKKMLGEMISTFGKPAVLEVEPPEDDITRRRIAFYERNGFALNHYEYVQLAYGEDSEPVPLKIMSCPDALDEEGFIKVRNTLYRELFGVISPNKLLLDEDYK